MGLLDGLRGKKPAPASADGLRGLPEAAASLQQAGIPYGGKAGICFRPFDTTDFDATKSAILAQLKRAVGHGALATASDEFGYLWALLAGNIGPAVASIQSIYQALQGGGLEQYILCSVFRFAKDGRAVYLIYNRDGQFYPFAPLDKERDIPLELKIKGLLKGSLPVEKAITRWYPLWGLPV